MNLSATSSVHPMIMGDGKLLIPEEISTMEAMMTGFRMPAGKSSTTRWIDVSVFSCADDVLNRFVRDANLNKTGVF